jgi:methionine-rich copper-binding protein CopC
MVRASLAVLALLASLLLEAPSAAAHAILMESMPAADGAVSGPRVAFTLRYNSRIDRKRSRLTLTSPDKATHDLAIREIDRPDQLVADAVDLAPGSYSLRWQVLAIDGHITRGDIPFTVAAP